MTEAEQVMKRCQIGTHNYNEANNLHADCYRVIGKLLAEHAMRETQRLGQEIEQEPVAWMKSNDTEWSISFFEEDGYIPLYATPPQRKPLNWEPIQEFWRNNSNIDWDELESAIKQAAHGIKGDA